jgi:FkbM family methyltransferase
MIAVAHLQLISDGWRLSRTDARKLFIDCGSNLGQGFKVFSRHFKPVEFDYIFIEPNPYCRETLTRLCANTDRSRYIEAAASNQFGTARFFGLFGEKGLTSDGASICPEVRGSLSDVKVEDSIEVKTFDIASFIRDERATYPIIVIKLDVEGAEYQILEHLLNAGVGNLIDTLYVEFHHETAPRDEIERLKNLGDDLVQRLGAKGVRVRSWK